MSLDIVIEGVLFYKSTPISHKELANLCSCNDDALQAGLTTLQTRLASGATRLVVTESEVQLVTAPELDELITSIRRDEAKRDIGKAGAETLAVILYREPVSRAEIDQIRGVNSGFILRNLLTRGLIERTANKNSYTYKITPDLLAHLGIGSKTELPGYSGIMDKLDAFAATTEKPHD